MPGSWEAQKTDSDPGHKDLFDNQLVWVWSIIGHYIGLILLNHQGIKVSMAVDSFSMCHQCVCCGIIPIPPIPIDVVSRLGLLMDVCSFNDPEAAAPVAPEVSPKKQGKLC